MNKDRSEDQLEVRFHLNMRRIAGLTALIFPSTASLAPTAEALESEDVRADLFRAVVVFLHATFEDSLRTAARQRLGDATPEVLKNIPLVGTSRLGRAERFHLGSLAAHRGKTVDQLIRESVEDYLTVESFSSCSQVESILRQMGLDATPFQFLYADLGRMMKRRHRIVHEADLPSPRDSSPSPWTIADHFDVCLWNMAVLAFYALLRVSLDPADEIEQWYFARRTEAIALARKTHKELSALRDQPVESIMFEFQVAGEKLQRITALLGPPSEEELQAISKRMKGK